MPSQAGRRPRIFVVDDEFIVADALATQLRKKGLDAQAFQGPHDALRADFSSPPDLLVSDVALQIFTGIELAARIRERSPNCRVLLFSCSPETNHLLQLAHFEGKEFTLLFGPVSLSELVAQIFALVDGEER